MSLSTTLSLEPISQVLSSIEAGLGYRKAGSEDGALSIRLQRLWQERGDFSKLTAAGLQDEASKEGQDDQVGVKSEKAGNPDKPDSEERPQREDGEDQLFTPEQLWDLKSSILQGLGLARNDITSALDLLQLLLSPLNVLNPPVPEEALALPSGSFCSTTLPAPLPAPSEAFHLTNTALAFSTKLKALDTASTSFKNASLRLNRAINDSQAEWTDLLRLKRTGEWKIEARAALASSSGSETVQIDKMAKDLCIFCGIEEAKTQWRQAGLARLKDKKGKNSAKDQEEGPLDIPLRIGGRRRLALRVSFKLTGRETEEELSFIPRSDLDKIRVDVADEISVQFLEAQLELFDEELFAQIVQEARDSEYRVTAGRDTVSISNSEAFTLHLAMVTAEDSPTVLQSSLPQSSAMARLLSALCRLRMIDVYKSRRQDLHPDLERMRPSSSQGHPQIITRLMGLIDYYSHISTIETILSNIRKALLNLAIFSQASETNEEVSLDFGWLLDSSSDVVANLESGSNEIKLGGSASLVIGSHDINITFFYPTNIVTLHLPKKVITMTSRNELIHVLHQAVRAAVLDQLVGVLKVNVGKHQGWDIIPLPGIITMDARALARKQVGKTVTDFISIFPVVALQEATCSITLEATYSKRELDLVIKKTFESFHTHGEALRSDSFLLWLAEIS